MLPTLAEWHAIAVHFPIALLVVSVALSFIERSKRSLRQTAQITLWLGTLASFPATLTGQLAHIPYHQTFLLDLIFLHAGYGYAAATLFAGLSVWRWIVWRRGNNAVGWPYLVVASLGCVLLILVGASGGKLVYDYGVNVKGVNPLLSD